MQDDEPLVAGEMDEDEDGGVLEIDPFFQVICDGKWNACVGVQGSEIDYIKGYLDAARMVADALVTGEMMRARDTLVMPILFNARHGFELALKYVVSQLTILGRARRMEGRPNHHILRYWEHIAAANVGDLDIRAAIVQLEPYARSLSRIDVDGQQLRYFQTMDDRPSLGDQAVVHLLLVRESVDKLTTLLSDLTERILVLHREDPTGTRTTRCSRSDLAEIARMVGSHSTWVDDEFLDRKASVMSRFGLSKRAFSNALGLIKASRELAGRIGIERDQCHVSDAKVIEVARIWLEVHPLAREAGKDLMSARDIGLNGIMRYSEEMDRLVRMVMRDLTLEEFADIEAIYYIGRNREYGEYYDSSLINTIDQHRREERHRFEKIYHILSKSNLLEELVTGFRGIGRPSLATRLAELQEATRQATKC